MAGWRRELLSNPDKGQVLWVNYEDLKTQPHVEIRRVAAHIGIAVDEALVERVVEHSRFDNMKKQAGNIPFFRKGRVGEKKEKKETKEMKEMKETKETKEKRRKEKRRKRSAVEEDRAATKTEDPFVCIYSTRTENGEEEGGGGGTQSFVYTVCHTPLPPPTCWY